MRAGIDVPFLLVLSVGLAYGAPAYGVPNPETALCNVLGYKVESRSWDGGGGWACVFTDGSFCPAWSFLYGECGTEWTVCEKNGGKITVSQGSCPLSSDRCALCTTANGQTCYEVEKPGCIDPADGKPPSDASSDGCSCRAARGDVSSLAVWGVLLGIVLLGLARAQE